MRKRPELKLDIVYRCRNRYIGKYYQDGRDFAPETEDCFTFDVQVKNMSTRANGIYVCKSTSFRSEVCVQNIVWTIVIDSRQRLGQRSQIKVKRL